MKATNSKLLGTKILEIFDWDRQYFFTQFELYLLFLKLFPIFVGYVIMVRNLKLSPLLSIAHLVVRIECPS